MLNLLLNIKATACSIISLTKITANNVRSNSQANRLKKFLTSGQARGFIHKITHINDAMSNFFFPRELSVMDMYELKGIFAPV